MKNIKKLVALSLVLLSVFAIAMPALAATGVLKSNVRVWKDLTFRIHYGYAPQNSRVTVIGTSTMASDGQIYVKVRVTSGSMSGTEGYILQHTIKPT
jgi:hypothetical protein